MTDPTDDRINELAAEAEQGYDPARLRPRLRWGPRRRWLEGRHNSGWLLLEPAAPTCPSCKRFPILYNGNWFCQDLGGRRRGRRWGGSCNWSLPHPVTKKRDREICDQLGIGYG